MPNIGTRYVYIVIRTFIDANNPVDIKLANQLQDEIKVECGRDICEES